MKYYVILTILLTACGSDDSSTPATELTNLNQAGPYHTLSLDKKSELPDCTPDNLNQLAYVKSEGKFYECEGDWQVVNIKGRDGRDGKDGKDFLTTSSSSTWTDPITRYQWFMGGMAQQPPADTLCVTDHMIPNTDDLMDAVGHGLFLHLQSHNPDVPKLAWTDEFMPSTTTIGVVNNMHGSMTVIPIPFGGSALVLCVNKG